MKIIHTLLLASLVFCAQSPINAENPSTSNPVQQHSGEGAVTSITSNDFDSFVQSDIVIVDFYADWCGPCKKLHPIFSQLAQSYSGKVRFGKINIDHAKPIANKFHVKTIPTVILFKNGKEVKRHGPGSKQEFIQWIENAL